MFTDCKFESAALLVSSSGSIDPIPDQSFADSVLIVRQDLGGGGIFPPREQDESLSAETAIGGMTLTSLDALLEQGIESPSFHPEPAGPMEAAATGEGEPLLFAALGIDLHYDELAPYAEDPASPQGGTPPPPNDDTVDDDKDDEIVVTARRVDGAWQFWGTPADADGSLPEAFRIDQLDPGDVPEIIEWSAPLQPTENVRANPAVTITVTGNIIRISGFITFQGPGATESTAAQLLAALNATWSGSGGAWGDYTVITDMRIGPGGIVVDVQEGHGQPATSGLGGFEIRAFNVDGRSDAAFHLQSFAHEFGHVLGLMDLYDAYGSMGKAPGYENNIMNNSAALPNWQNIRDLISENS